jgi:hypothetical protein
MVFALAGDSTMTRDLDWADKVGSSWAAIGYNSEEALSMRPLSATKGATRTEPKGGVTLRAGFPRNPSCVAELLPRNRNPERNGVVGWSECLFR